MEKSEALAEFYQQQVVLKSQEKLEQLKNYCQTKHGELAKEMREAFRKLCLKTKTMQEKEGKGAIASFEYLLRRVDLVNRRYVYQVEALDKRWLDDPVRCRVEYDVSWAFKFLEEFETELLAETKAYLNQITPLDIEAWKLKEITKYHEVICELAEVALVNLGELPEFQAVNKELLVEVIIAEYKMPMRILYKEDHRIKDSRQIKRWLELKEESYRHEILKNLDLSEGDYAEIRLNRGDLSGSSLVQSDLSQGMFVKTKFQGCEADEADFHEADLREADFRNASLVRANFRGAYLKDACFDGANLMGANLSGAYLGGATFVGAIMNEVIFEEEEEADFEIEPDEIEESWDEAESEDGDDQL